MQSTTDPSETLLVPNRQPREPRNQPNNETNKRKPLHWKAIKTHLLWDTYHTCCRTGQAPLTPLAALGLSWWQWGLTDRLWWSQAGTRGRGRLLRKNVGLWHFVLWPYKACCHSALLTRTSLAMDWPQIPKISRLFLIFFINRSF